MKDTIETLVCPACGKLMKKVYLNSQGFFIDVCTEGCGGVWFDNRELAKVDEKNEDIKELCEVYKGKTFSQVDKNAERKCPLCGQKMVKNSVSAKQEITIDECYKCGGKFFDYNELEQMRNQYENDKDRLADIKKLSESSVKMEKLLQELLKQDRF
ncbi:MAG: zf-TFIIB domain-containing protein [Clostridium sp.]|nr:zf-TFIIB domain-containing protein [Clostridium sp.]